MFVQNYLQVLVTCDILVDLFCKLFARLILSNACSLLKHLDSINEALFWQLHSPFSKHLWL